MKCHYFNQEKEFCTIREPYTCCDPKIEVSDGNKQSKYVVTADCCQCGICCSGSYGKLTDTFFGIHEANKEDFSLSSAEGKIHKHPIRYGLQMMGDADSFEVTFPTNATPEDKLSLICTVLMLDYLFFEDSGARYRRY